MTNEDWRRDEPLVDDEGYFVDGMNAQRIMPNLWIRDDRKPINGKPSPPNLVCLEAIAASRSGRAVWNKLPLSAFLDVNSNGEFTEPTMPIWVGIPDVHQEDVVKEMDMALNGSSEAYVEWADDPEKEGQTLYYVYLGEKSEGPTTVFTTTTIEARASFQHYVQGKNVSRFQEVKYDALTAEAHWVKAPYYWGGGAGAYLIQAEASIFDLTLGIGVETGIGVKDETFEVELAGCGIMIGRRVGISVFGNEFSINLGRLFGF